MHNSANGVVRGCFSLTLHPPEVATLGYIRSKNPHAIFVTPSANNGIHAAAKNSHVPRSGTRKPQSYNICKRPRSFALLTPSCCARRLDQLWTEGIGLLTAGSAIRRETMSD